MDEEMKRILKEILIEIKLMITMEAAKQLNNIAGLNEQKYIEVLSDTIKTKREEIDVLTFGPLGEDVNE